jgi:hypothetical protein
MLSIYIYIAAGGEPPVTGIQWNSLYYVFGRFAFLGEGGSKTPEKDLEKYI